MKNNNILEIEVYSNESICQEHSYFSESFDKELQSSVHFQLTNSIFSISWFSLKKQGFPLILVVFHRICKSW